MEGPTPNESIENIEDIEDIEEDSKGNNTNNTINENPNKCNRCGKEFRFLSHLQRHINGKKQCKIKTNKYLCKYCNKPYSTKSNLNQHFKTCKIKKENGNNNNNNSENNNSVNINNDVRNKQQIDTLKSIIELLLADIVKNDNNNTNTLLTNIANIINGNSSNSNVTPNTSNTSNTSNTVITNSGNTNNNNNITINNVQNVQNVQNIQNNITTLAIGEEMIYPFGYEDIKFIPKEEMINILKSPIGAQLALEKTYSKLENTNFYKKNTNKDFVTTLTKDMTIKVDTGEDFKEKIAKHGIILMERMLYECDNDLEFKDKMAILANIEEISYSLKFNVNLAGIVRFLEAHYQSDASKAIIKKFLKSLTSNPYKERKISIAKQMIKELETFNEELKSGNLTKEFLEQEVWSKKLHQNRSELDNPDNFYLNNLNYRYYKDTPRYKFYKRMQEEEFDYFQKHDLSVANVYKYRKILLKRANDELEKIAEEYDKVIYDGAKEALIDEPQTQLVNSVSNARLKNNLIRARETEAMEAIQAREARRETGRELETRRLNAARISFLNHIAQYNNNLEDNIPEDNNLEDSDNESQDSRLHDLSDVSSINNDTLEAMNQRIADSIFDFES